ncbi:Methyltransf_25 domain-containing protein [Gammaproteobacteria bacterium]
MAPPRPEDFAQQLQSDAPFLDMVSRYITPAGHILECGCGLARTAMSMAHLGYQITALDHDPQILELARISAGCLNLSIDFLQGDFLRLDEFLMGKLFDGVSHQGVLEHYEPSEIIATVAQQLRVSPVVICSVPIKSPFNLKYFQDNLYRNLWPETVWWNILQREFYVAEAIVVSQRTDNLILAIKKSLC